MGKRELVALLVFLVSCECCVALPHDATDLSAVCDFVTVNNNNNNNNTNDILHLTYNNDVLNSVENEKVLGVRIDNNLTWSIHINFIAKKISSNLWLLSKLKDSLSTEHRVQFYKTYIQPHID